MTEFLQIAVLSIVVAVGLAVIAASAIVLFIESAAFVIEYRVRRRVRRSGLTR